MAFSTRRTYRRVTGQNTTTPWNTAVTNIGTPYLWYKFDDATSSWANSGSLGSYTVAPTSPTNTGATGAQRTGSFGNLSAAEFIHVHSLKASNQLVTYASSGTVAWLVRPYSFGISRRCMGGFAGVNSSVRISFSIASNGAVSVDLAGSVGNLTRRLTTTKLCNLMQWNLIVVVFDGVVAPTIYVNGAVETAYTDVASGTPAGFFLNDTGFNNVGFGYEPILSGGLDETLNFHGLIDEFVYWDGLQLAGTDVTQLYDSSLIAVTSQAPTNFEEKIATYTPHFWLRCNESGSPSSNVYNLGTQLSTPTTDRAWAVQGTHSYGTAVTTHVDGFNIADTLNGTNAYWLDTQVWIPTAANGGNIGAFFWVGKCTKGAGTNSFLFDIVRTSGTTQRFFCSINKSANKLQVDMLSTASSDGREWLFPWTPDSNEHFFALVQRGDGTGIHFFLDGVEITTTSTIIGAGTPTVNTWFSDVEYVFQGGGSLVYQFGALARPVQDWYKGDVDHISVCFNRVFTDADIAALQALRA